MESSSYGSSHLSSPALVVFSQAANGLSDALRLQRPFTSQIPDAKDLHHLSLSYGAHLLHGFQPNFLHPHFNPAVTSASNTNPFSGGGAFVKPFPSNLPLHSAFAPPKGFGFGLDQSPTFSPKGIFANEPFRTDSSSPACTSLSPPTKDESMEGHSTSEDGERDRICSPSRSPEPPGFRRVGPKKPPIGTPSPTQPCCPVCGIQIPPNELEQHFTAELSRLAKPNSYMERQELRRTLSMEMHAVQNSYQGRTSRWETFNRIRTNRQSRLRGKFRKRRFDGSDGDFSPLGGCQSCPVCHGRLQRTQEEIAQHIEECARKQQQSTQDEDETVDVESIGDEASNGAINMSQSLNNNNNNNNNNNQKHDPTLSEKPDITSMNTIIPAHWDRTPKQHPHHHRMPLPLNCKKDSNNIAILEDFYKRACFAGNTAPTSDVISRVTPTSSDQRMEIDYHNHHHNNQTRESSGSRDDEEVVVDNVDEDRRRTSPNGDKTSPEEATSSVEVDSATETNSHSSVRPQGLTPNSESYVSTSETATEPASKAQVLEELKARIRELEGSPHHKCFTCNESCKTLVLSTICGHYLCEDCWVHESDTKKSCPRCKIVTCNSDFRKIHV